MSGQMEHNSIMNSTESGLRENFNDEVDIKVVKDLGRGALVNRGHDNR